jgi:hypothetical protein
MASSPLSIPGYYWDSERKKYFKISKNHLANTEQERRYSDFFLAHELEIPEERAEVAAPTIATSRSSLSQSVQDLRHRTEGVSLDSLRKAYLAMCRSNILEPRVAANHSVKFKYPWQGEMDKQLWATYALDWDPQLKTVWSCAIYQRIVPYGVPRVTIKVSRVSPGAGNVFSVDDPCRTNITRDLVYNTSRPPVMAALHGVGVVTVRLEPSSQKPALLLDLIRHEQLDPAAKLPSFNPLCVVLNPGESTAEGHTYISVTPPSHGTPAALVGLTRGFTRVDLASGRNDETWGFPSDILCAEWLQPGVGALGFRNSTVLLWDFRASQGAIRLKHGGSVAHLAPADASGNSLVATGVRNALALYDLRMSRLAVSSAFPPNRIRASQTIWKADHENRSDLGLGFSLMGDVVAAAQDDGALKVFSTKTGGVLRTFPEPRLTYHPNTFKHVKVIEDDMYAIQVLGVHSGEILFHGIEEVWEGSDDDDEGDTEDEGGTDDEGGTEDEDEASNAEFDGLEG